MLCNDGTMHEHYVKTHTPLGLNTGYMDANYIVPMLEFEHHLMFALQSRLMHYWSILLS